MKQITIIFLVYLVTIFTNTFSQNINIEEYTLDNGLKIYLNEDHDIPFVFGAVAVKGGSKYDPKDATGIAHYMEHLMFKGTEEIGTTNYQAEKVFLDSISLLYNKIAETNDELLRLKYQMGINKLSQKASKFVILNETDNLLKDIGSLDINAYTSEDAIVYHNVFPGHQIGKWLEIYSHRFEKPVFRMFQNELEVVYEEKNMSLDEPFNQFYEEYSRRMYKNHPYGQQTVLGTIEHLKNPSISKLYKYVEKFYVPNNMAIILCGNFSTTEAKQIIKQEFGSWKKSPDINITKPIESEIDGREVYEVAISPVEYGVLGFRSVPMLHADENLLTICSYLLENDMGTGKLDSLSTLGKILDVSIYQNHRVDYGDIIIEFSPNKSSNFVKSEKLIIDAIQQLKNGNFSDAQLNAAKRFLKKEKLKTIEYVYDYQSEGENFGRLDLITELFLCNKTWNDLSDNTSKIDEIQKTDVVSIASKYFTENYIAVFSKKGEQEIQKLGKPAFDPVVIESENKESEFAKNFRRNIETESQVKHISFSKDITKIPIDSNLVLYHTYFDFNELFHLKINIGIGKKEMPELEYLAYYMNSCGTKEFPINKFYQKLESLGISIDANCTNHFFEISLEGFNQNLKQAIEFANNLLNDAYIDNRALMKLADVEIYEREYLQQDPYTIGDALTSYALYGNNSPYLKRLSNAELKSLTDENLLQLFELLNKVESSVHYSGNLPISLVSNLLQENITVYKTQKSKSPIFYKRNPVTENTIFVIDMPEAIQSQIYYYVEGEVNDSSEQAIGDIFTNYLDEKLYSEIRDFHSLAYTSYYSFENGFRDFEKGYNIAYLSTQSDKTINALEVLLKNMTNIEFSEHEIENIKNRFIQSANCKSIGKRNMSEFVEWWQLQGLKTDPIVHKTSIFKQATLHNIREFYSKNVANRKYIITIVGDKSQINMLELARFGKIVELNVGDVFKE